MTIDASTRIPIEIMRPPRLIILEVILNCLIRIKEISKATGISIKILIALLKWKRNTSTIKETIIHSSMIARSKVLIEDEINPLLS